MHFTKSYVATAFVISLAVAAPTGVKSSVRDTSANLAINNAQAEPVPLGTDTGIDAASKHRRAAQSDLSSTINSYDQAEQDAETDNIELQKAQATATPPANSDATS